MPHFGKDCSLYWQPLVLFDLRSSQSADASCQSGQHSCSLGLATTETASDLDGTWARGKRLEVGCAHPWRAVISRCEGGWRNKRERVNCRGHKEGRRGHSVKSRE